jgi:hypothetical protein
MYTFAGRDEAHRRHKRMVDFLDGFFEEAAAPPEWKALLDEHRETERRGS